MNYGENLAVLEEHEQENAQNAPNRMLTSTTMPWNLNKLGEYKADAGGVQDHLFTAEIRQVSAFRASLPWIKL